MRALARSPAFTAAARGLGIVAAAGTVLLCAVYAVVLLAGLHSLASPLQPIGEPFFTAMEILILLMTPLIVALMVAVHAWAPARAKVFSLLAVVFASLLAALTCSLHFVILTLTRQAAFAGFAGRPLLLSFEWPSVPYALDILAWDVFFGLSLLCAAPAFRDGRLATSIRRLLVASGVLALAGLSGVITGNMQLRSLGIVGYAGLFPVAALLMGVLFHRTAPRENS